MDFQHLPSDLPEPKDDGAAAHLVGLALPTGQLPATDGTSVSLASLPGLTVVYAYPRTGAAGETPNDEWNSIPGARGCTPQSCAFRDHHSQLSMLGARVFGLSTQPTEYQQEVVTRLHLPFPLLSDEQLALTAALKLPTFVYDGKMLLKRLTMIIQDGWIEHVMYPVFPPDQNAQRAIDWLKINSSGGRIE